MLSSIMKSVLKLITSTAPLRNFFRWAFFDVFHLISNNILPSHFGVTNNTEIYILGNFNNNLFLNNSCIFQKNNLLQGQSILSDIKKYYEFCTMFGLKQLIEVPTRVTCSSSTIIDHILASIPNRVSQQRVIDVALLITKLYTALEKSPESKEVRTSKLDAVH